jgi:N-methylhydantoinase A
VSMSSTTDPHRGGAYCIGVDVGGTFTDVVLSDGLRLWRAKAISTHGAIGEGVLEGCRLVAAEAGLSLQALMPRVERFGLGTTAVTNIIATRTGLRLGLITTSGFEELVPMARVRRIPRDGWLVPPDSLVDRECIVGVAERIDRNGTVLTPLDVAEVLAAAKKLDEVHHVEAIVVSFLWSCSNPVHEQTAIAAIAAAMPDKVIIAGSSLLPVMREYERSTFALLNAYAARALDGVDTLVERLRELGLRKPPLLVHSGGGSISVQEGRRIPALLAESGPAAGVLGALEVCDTAGISNAVTCDIGGTSFDISLICDGSMTRRTRGDLMGIWTALPRVDVESASAGGGSVGWVDAMGLLRLGPRSAGAAPGPACYGRGGAEPTVTDALLVLGYIDPKKFLGGKMPLNLKAATEACGALATRLGLETERVAWGIRELALTEMARALRAEFARHGYDSRDYSLVSMGGCGGLLNAVVAQQVGLSRVLMPELTSVLSAFGAASADVRRERSLSIGRILPMPAEELQSLVDGLCVRTVADLEADGIAQADRSIAIELDLRFMRQQWELAIPANNGFDEPRQRDVIAQFTAEYARRYGQGALVSGAPVEVATVRVIGTGRTVRPSLHAEREVLPSRPKPSGHRVIVVESLGDMARRDIATYERDALHAGCTIDGPALIDAVDTTLWVPDRSVARVDAHRTLNLELFG